jgi:hypothetical protein
MQLVELRPRATLVTHIAQELLALLPAILAVPVAARVASIAADSVMTVLVITTVLNDLSLPNFMWGQQ